MKTNVKTLGTIGAVVVLAGGYFALSSWASSEAVREVRMALIDANLDRAVRYGDVSASLLGGSVTLHDVQVRDADGRGIATTAAKLVVSEIEKDHDRLTAIRMRFEGLSLPVLEASRQPKESGGLLAFLNPTTRIELVGMGYSTLNGTMEIYGQVDPGLREASVDIEADFDDFQAIEMKLAVAGVDKSTFDAVIDAQALIAAKTIFGLLDKAPKVLEAASRLELKDLQITTQDRGLHARALPNLAEKYLISGSPHERAVSIAGNVKRDIRYNLERQNTAPLIVDEISTKIAGYVEEGGELTMTTRIDHPIPLFERGGFLGVRPAPVIQSVDRFVALTDAKLKN